MSEAVGVELLERISKPLIFKDATVGVGLSQPRPVNGYVDGASPVAS